ncbi:MAG: hypothetical protein EOP09_03885 [Proteobacteria bacterium]|nr:MAG: hypothetical protein EOP09_03885 [Pseudomonadota bacterium]
MNVHTNIVAAYLDGQPGVAFYGRKAFWSSNINLSEESYLYNDEVPPLNEGQVIFLSFSEALNRNSKALRVVLKTQLQIVDGQSASILSAESPGPILAKCTVDGAVMVGFIYQNPKKFLSHVSRLPYFDQFPVRTFPCLILSPFCVLILYIYLLLQEDSFAYTTEPNKAYFFSALSIVCNFDKPFTAVPFGSITLFPSSPHSNRPATG